jgi:hypothetical protein
MAWVRRCSSILSLGPAWGLTGDVTICRGDGLLVCHERASPEAMGARFQSLLVGSFTWGMYVAARSLEKLYDTMSEAHRNLISSIWFLGTPTPSDELWSPATVPSTPW